MRALVLALLGLALPAGLVLAVYAASAGELGAAPAVVTVPSQQIAVPVATTTERTATRPDDDELDDDLPGKCKDPERRLEPDCDPDADDRDSSGPGSGEAEAEDEDEDEDDDSRGRGRGRGRGGDD
jgi:hypothetical protein